VRAHVPKGEGGIASEPFDDLFDDWVEEYLRSRGETPDPSTSLRSAQDDKAERVGAFLLAVMEWADAAKV
jgi:hypothetical protein